MQEAEGETHLGEKAATLSQSFTGSIAFLIQDELIERRRGVASGTKHVSGQTGGMSEGETVVLELRSAIE